MHRMVYIIYNLWTGVQNIKIDVIFRSIPNKHMIHSLFIQLYVYIYKLILRYHRQFRSIYNYETGEGEGWGSQYHQFTQVCFKISTSKREGAVLIFIFNYIGLTILKWPTCIPSCSINLVQFYISLYKLPRHS